MDWYDCLAVPLAEDGGIVAVYDDEGREFDEENSVDKDITGKDAKIESVVVVLLELTMVIGTKNVNEDETVEVVVVVGTLRDEGADTCFREQSSQFHGFFRQLEVNFLRSVHLLWKDLLQLLHVKLLSLTAAAFGLTGRLQCVQ